MLDHYIDVPGDGSDEAEDLILTVQAALAETGSAPTSVGGGSARCFKNALERWHDTFRLNHDSHCTVASGLDFAHFTT